VIFVTVGNFLGFPRLVNAVDRLKAQGLIQDDVLLQVGGAADFESGSCKVVAFLQPDHFEQQMREANVVVSHCGTGALIDALRAGKTPVVMPRRKQYGEAVDDHQLEIAQALAAEGRAILAYEPEDLPGAIEQARMRSSRPSVEPPARMIDLVGKAIEEILAGQD